MLNRANPMLFLLMLLLSQGCVNGRMPLADVGSPNAKSTEPEPAMARPGEPVAAASRVYRDSVTGEFTGPPPAAEVPSAPVATRKVVSTEPAPAMQETAIEGGGTLIHLQGRFHSHMSATKDAAGNVTVHCDDKPPAR